MRFLTYLLILFSNVAHAGFFDVFRSPSDSIFSQGNNFIVVNVATQMIRVYDRRCKKENDCANVLVFQTPTVVGKDNAENRTPLGSYLIMYWAKFYGTEKFPGLDPKQLPDKNAPGYNRSSWKGLANFGYYASIQAPSKKDPKKKPGGVLIEDPEKNVLMGDGSYIHGIPGYASDGDKFLKNSRTNHVSAVSHGCMRVSQDAILTIRNMIDNGTPVFRIYAQESVSRTYSPNIQHFMFAIEEGRDQGYRGLGTTSGESKIIEQGNIDYDIAPKAVDINNKEMFPFANPYRIPAEQMKGVFSVDGGTLSADYEIKSKKIKTKGEDYPDYFFQKKKQ